MNDEINTIKAALEKAKEAACVLGWIGHGYKLVEALKLLETIDPDAIRLGCDTKVQETLTACGVHKDAGIRWAISDAILGKARP